MAVTVQQSACSERGVQPFLRRPLLAGVAL